MSAWHKVSLFKEQSDKHFFVYCVSWGFPLWNDLHRWSPAQYLRLHCFPPYWKNTLLHPDTPQLPYFIQKDIYQTDFKSQHGRQWKDWVLLLKMLFCPQLNQSSWFINLWGHKTIRGEAKKKKESHTLNHICWICSWINSLALVSVCVGLWLHRDEDSTGTGAAVSTSMSTWGSDTDFVVSVGTCSFRADTYLLCCSTDTTVQVRQLPMLPQSRFNEGQ